MTTVLQDKYIDSENQARGDPSLMSSAPFKQLLSDRQSLDAPKLNNFKVAYGQMSQSMIVPNSNLHQQQFPNQISDQIQQGKKVRVIMKKNPATCAQSQGVYKPQMITTSASENNLAQKPGFEVVQNLSEQQINYQLLKKEQEEQRQMQKLQQQQYEYHLRLQSQQQMMIQQQLGSSSPQTQTQKPAFLQQQGVQGFSPQAQQFSQQQQQQLTHQASSQTNNNFYLAGTDPAQTYQLQQQAQLQQQSQLKAFSQQQLSTQSLQQLPTQSQQQNAPQPGQQENLLASSESTDSQRANVASLGPNEKQPTKKSRRIFDKDVKFLEFLNKQT